MTQDDERSDNYDVAAAAFVWAVLMVVPLWLAPELLGLWSALTIEGPEGPPAAVEVPMLMNRLLQRDAAGICLAGYAGAMGGILHGLVSLTSYIGNQRFFKRWALWYLARPLMGGLVGGFFVAVLQGGLVSNATALNINGVVAMGAVAGLFSKQALDRLRKVFDALFGQEADDRRDKLDDPAVATTSVVTTTTTVTDDDAAPPAPAGGAPAGT